MTKPHPPNAAIAGRRPPATGWLLETSKALGDGDVLKVAEFKSPAHLMAIAGRPAIDAVTTDVLINRGTPDVLRKFAGNEFASFSETGYVRMITKAQQDAALAKSISTRKDVPDELKSFLQLALG
ncbi:MAG: DUF2336 domain-containing protein [Hyphomicrobiales bacterium]|nr:DUF2336 domain-containing protein [Alphaproteobacteria bacterium]